MKSLYKGLSVGIILLAGFLVSGDNVSASSANCPFTATGNQILVNFESPIGRLYSTGPGTNIPTWKTYADMNLPTTLAAGSYKISLASYDEYDNRVNVTQDDERYKVIFKSSNGSTIATTGASGELPDRVKRGTWSGSVGEINLTASSSSIRVQHDFVKANYANSLNPSCMLIDPVQDDTDPIYDDVITDPDTGLQCNQIFENNYVRYDRAYVFSDALNNNSNYPVYLSKFKINYANPEFLDSGSPFAWTSEIKNAGYKVSAGQSKDIVYTPSPWRIAEKPDTRSTGKRGNSDFMIAYTLDYDKNDTPNDASDDASHVECIYYSVTSCGDGVLDSAYETCDPNDSSKAGWGNSGCSNTCDPIITVPTPTTCDSLNVSTTSIKAGGSVNYTCATSNETAYKVACGNGGVISAETGTCEYPHAGTYTMECSVAGEDDVANITSNACKKTISVASTNPAIEVIKTALDGTDTQTVGSSTTARFKIKVENVGDENLDRNIILSDANSSSCGGTVILPTNTPSTFENVTFFGNGNHNNQILEPGEGFTYTCEKTGVTADFVNTIVVSAQGADTNGTVSDTDSTNVQMEEVVVPVAQCPYQNSGNKFVVDFSGTKLLSNNHSTYPTEKLFYLGKTIPAGRFKISLYASDGYHSRISSNQPNERYKVVFQNNGSVLATSNPTQDLADYVVFADWSGTVNTALPVGAFNQVKVMHDMPIDPTSPNSLDTICMLVEPLDDGTPSIMIDKTDDNSAQDTDGNVGNDSQTILVGDTSKFKIKVTNNGTEALKNIVIFDPQAQNCSGTVSLPSTYPSSWENFTLSGNNDAYLDPGESFTYNCSKPSTTTAYTNTISVNAKGKNTDGNVNDSNTSEVYVDTDTSISQCPYTPTGSQILIKFSENYTLGTWKPEVRSKEYSNFTTIKEGRYRVSLSAFDGYKDRSNPQLEEQYRVVFRKSNGSAVVSTNVTQDLRDDSNNAAWFGVVNENLYIPEDISKLSTDHRFQTAPFGSANSLKALCMLLEPIGEDGEPSIAIDKRDDNSNDTDTVRGDDTQTVNTGAKAVFKIKVTNTGTEDLKEIVVTDPRAVNCAGTVTLPGTIPASWSGFDVDGPGNNGNNVLEPGEYFEYTCEKTNTRDDYTNIASVTAKGTDSNESVDDTDATIIIVEGGRVDGPSIIVDKSDANVADIDNNIGNDTQTVAEGAIAVFKITVTNNGTEDLKEIVLTDARAANCSGTVTLPDTKPTTWNGFTVGGEGNNNNAVLEPGEFFEYTCEKSNTTAEYVNTVIVTAKGNTSNEAVNDNDPTVILIDDGSVDGPSIIIDKIDANTADIDNEQGNDTQTVSEGEDARFKIRVTNNGDEDLKEIVLTDEKAANCAGSVTLPDTFPSTWDDVDKGGAGNETNNVLEPGEWFEYTCIKPNTIADYINTAGVTAKSNDSDESVNDSDTTPVIVDEDDNVDEPSIVIDKIDANPDDLDDSEGNDGQIVNPLEKAVFKIRVRNNGNENLTDIVLTDAKAENCAGSVTLPDTFPSTWSDVEKGGSGNNNDAVLEPGEFFEYTCEKGNTTEDYVNTAGVTAKGTDTDTAVNDSDTTVVELPTDGPDGPFININKVDANVADRDDNIGNDTQSVLVGEVARFKIIVTNTGDENLRDIVITDTLAARCAGTVTLPDTIPTTWAAFTVTGGDNTNAVLEPGESFSYTCAKGGTQGEYTNEAGVTAVGVDSDESVNDDDTSEVIIGEPEASILIDKVDANDNDSDGEIGDDSQEVAEGAEAVFKIRVTNNGDIDLENIVLTDALAPNCAGSVTLPDTFPSAWLSFDKGGNGSLTDSVLETGEYFEYTCERGDAQADYTNTAKVDADPVDGSDPVTDDDTTPVKVRELITSIKIDKVDDNAANDTDGLVGDDSQTVPVGEKAAFRITVENDGEEGLTDIKITDVVEASCGGEVTLPDTFPSSFRDFSHSGDDDILDPGESFSYTCSKLNTTEDYTNTAVVEATGVDSGTDVGDSDTTEVEIPAGSVCNGLVIEDAEGSATHKTDVECTGTDVETFEIDCGNGQTYTQAGSNSGVERLTRECSYSSNGNYNPTCKINGEAQAQNSCQGAVKVGSTGGGTTPNCQAIEIENNSTSTNTLTTHITCVANKDVKSFRLVYGNGEFETVTNVNDREHTFRDITYTNNSNDRVSYQAKCYISDNTRDDDDSLSDFNTRLACQDNVSVGDRDGSGSSSGGGFCGDGTVQRPNSDGIREECDKVIDDNGNSSFPNTCNSDCTLKNPGSSSGGPSGFCGDGVVQRPNDNGQNEECDRKVNTDGTYGDWPSFCISSGQNACKVDVVTLPGENEIKMTPGGNVLIGNDQDALRGEIPRLTVTGGDRIYLNKRFCTYNIDNTSILTGGNGECTDQIIGLLRPGEYVENTKARGYFKGNINTIPSGSTYSDTRLSTTLEGVQEGFFAKMTNVRVAKPSVATVGGGLSLQRESNVTGKISDVQELATVKSANQKASDSFGSDDNTNFQGASLGNTATNGDSGSLSSSAEEVNEGKALEQAEADQEEYIESAEVVEEVETTNTNTTTANSLSDGESYNGIENVYIFENENLILSGLDVDAENNGEARTYIINGGDLVINGDITGDTPIAFIVKGGNIKVAADVSKMNGTYVILDGGKVEGTGGLTSNQLVIKGGVYGDTTDLVSKRTYISNQGSGSNQVSVGTIVWKGASLFSKTPPLLRSFINEYTEETTVAR